MTMSQGQNDGESALALNGKRRELLKLLAAGGAISGLSVATAQEGDQDDAEGLRNSLLWAVAWKQTAAEYRALCYQAYSLARLRLDLALKDRDSTDRPLAVITDMDDTMMHAVSYWGYLVAQNKDFFDDGIWDEWLPNNLVSAAPGSLEFFEYCEQQGVEVFYVTSRNQGERTYEYALDQLKFLGVPFADEEHLHVFRESSDKTPARKKIAADFEIVLLIGDNLNDYKRDYYVKDVDERLKLMERDRADWGTKFIVLPNPTDGNWVRAIFGESEPAPTDDNRRLLKSAATRVAWDGA
jgi:5'-nucleotidase (lipoprotein e(P4) family)